MIRRAAAFAAAAIMLLTGCAESASEPVTAQPPFWVVENEDTGAVLYMLGTMHVGEKGIVYPEYVTAAFDSCDIVAVEIDTEHISEDEALSASALLLTSDGAAAKDSFGEHYDEVVAFLKEKGVYHSSMEIFIPYYWGTALTMLIAEDCGLSADHGTESIFIDRAWEQRKRVVEIESLSEQYAMMADIPVSVQVDTVLSGIGEENYAMQVEATRAMYEDWLRFDTEGLESLNDDMDGASAQLDEDYELFNDMMYVDRQKRMAEFAEGCLQSDEKVFMMVGAAHFYIEEDIITLLEDSGYTVREIRADDVQ